MKAVLRKRIGDDSNGGGMRGAVLGTALALLLLAPAPAAADVLYVQDGGVDVGVGCQTESCIGSQTFDMGGQPFSPVFGTVDIDPVGLTMDFDLWMQALSLFETVSGSEDNGVAEVEFTDVTYEGTGILVSESPPGSFSIDFGEEAAVFGDQTQWNDADVAVNSTPAFFDADPVLVTGNCFFVDAANASCSLTFGTTGFSLLVGEPTPQLRYFRHSMSLVLLPEPGAPLLLASGIAGLLLIGRRRIRP